jgi:cysteinyl-tRNA synthetase, unknown class
MNRYPKLSSWLILLTITAACLPASAQPPTATSPATTRSWDEIHNFTYWLDGPNLTAIAATHFELAVIDYSADGSAAGEFTLAQIANLQTAGCPRKVLAYLSIGEAEDYRWYWQDGWMVGNPAWIVAENPNWPGNYKVAYWHPAWQAIIFDYLDKLIAQGFDGIYLDIVDAYESDYAAGHEQDMVDFVIALANYGRTHSAAGQSFATFPQNAPELAAHPEYLAAINGIGKEETYYYATNDPTTPAERQETEAWLDIYRAQSGHAGPDGVGLVLTIDYATQPAYIADAYNSAAAKGYVEYVTDVDLDAIRIHPGYEPTCSTPLGQSLYLPLAALSND